MLSDKAFMSFSVLQAWNPVLRDADQDFLESYINSASLRIQNYIGGPVVRKQYTEVHASISSIVLKQDRIVSIDSVLYDPYRKWDGETSIELVNGDDFYWIEGSRSIDMISAIPYKKDVMKVVYTAGVYPIHFMSPSEPATAVSGQVWMDTADLCYKLYDGSQWSVLSSDEVVDPLLLNALVETVSYYKDRILRNTVGAKSVQGSSSLSFYQQTELSLPENVKDMLDGETRLI